MWLVVACNYWIWQVVFVSHSQSLAKELKAGWEVATHRPNAWLFLYYTLLLVFNYQICADEFEMCLQRSVLAVKILICGYVKQRFPHLLP